MINWQDITTWQVMVVDDEPDNLEVVAETLEYKGAQVKTAPNGQVALEILKDFPANLILTDLSMPVMDGRSFREQQLQSPDLSNIPVIVISAHLDHTVANDLNAAAYLRKPVKLAEVLRSVRTYCDPT